MPIMLAAFVFAFLGAMSVDYIPKNMMRYAVFFLLIMMAIYTFAKKDLGQLHTAMHMGVREILLGVGFGALIGFYDGVLDLAAAVFYFFICESLWL